MNDYPYPGEDDVVWVEGGPTATAPVLVGLWRGMAWAALVAAVEVLVVWLTTVDLGAWAVGPAVFVAAVRTAEGYRDQRLDPTRQQGRLGGTPTWWRPDEPEGQQIDSPDAV